MNETELWVLLVIVGIGGLAWLVWPKRRVDSLEVDAPVEPPGPSEQATMLLRQSAPAPALSDEIAKLWALKQQGALSDAEFEDQKERLLGGAAVAPASGGGVQLVLVSCGRNKIAVIKRVRELTRIGLKEALDMVERAPVAIADNLTAARAEELRQLFVNDGAVMELR